MKHQYGIWNGLSERFVFGISEDTADRAWTKFKRLNPQGYRASRYEAKAIPIGWTNPENGHFRKRGTRWLT